MSRQRDPAGEAGPGGGRPVGQPTGRLAGAESTALATVVRGGGCESVGSLEDRVNDPDNQLACLTYPGAMGVA